MKKKKTYVDKLLDNFEYDLDQKFNHLKKIMYTKEDHAKFMAWLEEEMRDLRS